MLSRVADSLYWMSRYLERAEHTARLVNVNLYLTLDRAPIDAARHWGRLLASLRMPPTMPVEGDLATHATGQVLDLANRDSIASSIAGARENARQVREQISSEMWQQINRLFLAVRRDAPDPGWTGRTHDFLMSAIEGVHLFQGITNATMTHGEGWHFIELGRYVERAGATAALLEVHYSDPSSPTGTPGVGEYVEWVGLLRSCCAFEAYCRQYTADLRADRIAEFLILSAQFPRSVRYAARHIQSSLQTIAQLTGRGPGRAQRLAGRLLASLDYGQVDEIMSGNLLEYLQSIVRQTGQIGAAVHQQYVSYPVDQALSA
jgi:uncharacterized alpha-E superfamily protein